MKTKKRLLSAALSLISAAALSAFSLSSLTAFAGDYDITVTSAINGETYKAYKILDIESFSTGKPTIYSAKAADGWGTYLAENDFTFDTNGYVTEAPDEDGLMTFADNLMALDPFAASSTFPDSTAEASATAANDTAVLDLSEPGYYLVCSTAGNAAIIDASVGNANWAEKNIKPTITKETASGYTNVAIGDVIPYTVTITAQKGAKNYVLTDTMSTGLTFNEDVAVYEADGETAIAETNYELTNGTNGFTLVFKQNYLNTLVKDSEIVVKYSAEVTSAIINNTNKTVSNNAQLTYGEKGEVTPETPVESETTSLTVVKYDATDTDKTPIKDAVFELYNGNTKLSLVAVSGSDGIYRLADSTDTNTLSSFTTLDGTKITIEGLDEDVEYSLLETSAPSGYNKLDAPVSVTPNGSELEIANNKGTELPSTGGTGTIVLVTVGSVLFVGLGILLVTKKRLYNEG